MTRAASNAQAPRPPLVGALSARRDRMLHSLALLGLLVGCDLVQGFQSAGDTLFPEESTHLNAPGLRVVEGGYRELRFASGAELFLLARPSESQELALDAMAFSNPNPCRIRDVGRYAASYLPTHSAALIAYFEDFSARARLRFADTHCKKHDFFVDDASLPFMEVSKGFVLTAGNGDCPSSATEKCDLLLVDPETSRRDLLSEGVQRVARDAFGGRHVVRSAGKLEVFSSDWVRLGTFGSEVRNNFGRARQSLIFEDEDGIFRLDSSGTDSSALVQVRISAGGCGLGLRSDGFITYQAPCAGESKVYAYHERSRRAFELGIDAESSNLRMVAAKGSAGDDPTRDAFWYFYLRVDSGTGTRDLFVRTPEGDEHKIGTEGWLSSAQVVEVPTGAYGYALIDQTQIAGSVVGTLVYWEPDGTVRPVAHGVLRDSQRLIVDFDGTSGKLAVVSGDQLEIVAERVPRDGFEYADSGGRWTVLFNEFDGAQGELSLMNGGLDAIQRAAAQQSLPQIDLQRIALNVPHFGAALMNHVLPGVLYFSEYDRERGTGTLVYRNLELRFTALVNEGISDFIVAEDDVIYSVPFGSAAGIWIVQGK